MAKARTALADFTYAFRAPVGWFNRIYVVLGTVAMLVATSWTA